MARKRRKHIVCHNCSEKLKDYMNYCPHCGQENHSLKVPFKQLAGEMLTEGINLDSKFLRSLKPLVFSPGELTNQFIDGRRVSYIAPIRLYFFITFVFFLFSSYSSVQDSSTVDQQEQTINFNLTTNSDSTARHYSNMEELRTDIDEGGMDDLLDSLEGDDSFIPTMVRKVVSLSKLSSKEITRYALNNVSIAVFIALPFLAMIFMVTYRERELLFIEHLIHSFHVHSFFFLFLTLYSVFTFYVYESEWLTLVLLIVVGGYLYKSCRNVYQLNRWPSIWRCTLVWFSYSLILFAVFVCTFAVSIYFY